MVGVPFDRLHPKPMHLGALPHQPIEDGGVSAGGRLSLVCQEIGHSVGLAHPDSGTSCMIVSVNRQHLIQHDIDLLNQNY